MRSRSFWMSAPKKLAFPRIILKPFSSPGLWLPVIWMPPSVPRLMDGEVEHRRGADADVDDVHARLGEAAQERRVEARAREATIATDREAKGLSVLRVGRSIAPNAAADALGKLIGEIAIGDATDVVFAKDVRRDASCAEGLPFFPRA